MDLKKAFIIFFVTSAIWGNSIKGIKLPFIGSLFPLRIAIVLFFFILLFRVFLLRDDITVFQTTELRCKSLRNWTLATTVGMLIYGFITMYWCYVPTDVVKDLITWFTSFMCIFMCLSLLKDKKDLEFAIKIYLINFLVIATLALYESFSGSYIYASSVERYITTRNAIGTYRPIVNMYNTNNYAIFIIFSVPILLMATSKAKNKLIADFFILALSELIIVLTGCNTAIIMFIVEFLVYLWLNKNEKSSFVLLFVAIFVLIALSSVIAEVLLEIRSFSSEDEPRWFIWKNCIEVASMYKFMGVGPGNGATVNKLFQVVNVSETERAHNYLLTIFEEFGFIGLILFSIWLYKFFSNMIYIHNNHKNNMFKYTVMFMIIFFPSTLCVSSMVGYFYYWLEFGIFIAFSEFIEYENYDKEELLEMQSYFRHKKV